jgi:hypothetical protein
MKQTLAAVVLLTLGALFGQVRSAQFPITTNNLIRSGGPAAFDGTNYLVGLQGSGLFLRADTHSQIAAQLVSQTGALLGSLIDVGRNGGFPWVAFDGTNYLLVWEDDALNPTNYVYGRFISKAGVLVRPPFPINTVGGGNKRIGGVAFDGTNYLAVWQDERNEGTNSDVYGQLITPGGLLLGSEIPISVQPDADKAPSVAFDGTNYLVVWQGRRPVDPELYDTYGRFISRNGTLGGLVLISQTPSPRYNPLNVAFDGANYFVVWNKDAGPGYPSPTVWNIYGRQVSRSGSLPGNELALITEAGNPLLPLLAFDGTNYLLSWTFRDALGTTNANIRFQFLNQTGSAVGSQFTVFTAQGTNLPTFGFPMFDGKRFFAATEVGVLKTNSSETASGDMYGAFILRSTDRPGLVPAPPFASGQFRLLLTGTPGIRYAVQAATNLSPTSTAWLSMSTNTATNGTFTWADSNAPPSRRFYRAVFLP